MADSRCFKTPSFPSLAGRDSAVGDREERALLLLGRSCELARLWLLGRVHSFVRPSKEVAAQEYFDKEGGFLQMLHRNCDDGNDGCKASAVFEAHCVLRRQCYLPAGQLLNGDPHQIYPTGRLSRSHLARRPALRTHWDDTREKRLLET